MKLTIERAALLTALTHTQSVVEKRNTIPILSNVLVDADGGQLRLTATDLDLAIVDQAEADIATPGSTTTPAHTLYDIVRKLPEGAQIELVFGEEGGRVPGVACGGTVVLHASVPTEGGFSGYRGRGNSLTVSACRPTCS